MMTLKLVRANRASFRGHPDVVENGQEVTVEDSVGEKLLKLEVKDSANNLHKVWKLVKQTDPDSNVDIEEFEGEEMVDEPEPAVAPKTKARVRKAPAKKKAPVRKKAATPRRTRAAAG